MLEILESPKHLIAMRLSGEFTAKDVEEAYKATREALDANERVSFFAEVDPTMQLTFEGIVKDVVEGISKWSGLKKYYRVALVTDKSWMAAIARLEGVVFSSIDIRIFGPAERDKAFAWAAEAPEPLAKPTEPEPSIHFLKTTSENVFAYEVDGRLRDQDIKAAVKELKPYFEQDSKFNVLARMKNYRGFDLLAIFDDEYIRLKLKSPSKIAKYAIVGPESWMRNLIELVGGFFPTKIRTFDPADEDEAWEWIGARPALLPE